MLLVFLSPKGKWHGGNGMCTPYDLHVASLTVDL